MPELAQFFHYRVIDVSSVRATINLWRKDPVSFPKNKNHRALDDIKEPIGELKHYKQFFNIEK